MPSGARRLFGLKKIYRAGYAYKKAGAMLMGIGEAEIAQGSLLLELGAGDPKPWAMRRDAMSPCYTTRWSDLPVAHAF